MELIEIREEDLETLTAMATDNNLEIWEVVRRLLKGGKEEVYN